MRCEPIHKFRLAISCYTCNIIPCPSVQVRQLLRKKILLRFAIRDTPDIGRFAAMSRLTCRRRIAEIFSSTLTNSNRSLQNPSSRSCRKRGNIASASRCRINMLTSCGLKSGMRFSAMSGQLWRFAWVIETPSNSNKRLEKWPDVKEQREAIVRDNGGLADLWELSRPRIDTTRNTRKKSWTNFFPAIRFYAAANPIRILTPSRAKIGAVNCPSSK